ncbi:MAG: alpha/beta hydrolase [Anaerolineae bacterium]
MAEMSWLVNPEREGAPFFWEAGEVGVLLVHGYTATPAEVRLLGRYLHERGYTVLGPLLPGHGTTPAEMNRCLWQDWTAAVEDAYRQLRETCVQVFVGGESMGGLLALYLAADHPAEAAGVMTYAPALRVPSRLQPWLTELLAPFVPTLPKGRSVESVADERWQGYSVDPIPAARELFRLQRVVRARLSRVTQPLLVVQGRLDRTVDSGVPRFLLEHVRSAKKELHWMPRSTHCVLLDQEWKAVAALTERFMQETLA